MLIDALRLRNFRNLRRVDVKPHPRFNILTGANGQGKTNLIEAIYLLGAAKSFRSRATNRNLVHFDEKKALLEARIHRGGHERGVRIEISPSGKQIFLNEQSVRNLTDFFGTLNIVVFGPADIGILKGSPSGRRQFIDRAIFNAHPAYATESKHYDDVLANRNSLLKEPPVDADLLSVYDDQFVQWGAKILERRLDFLRHFRPVMRRVFQAVFSEDLEAALEYDATWLPGRIDEERALEQPHHLQQLLAESLQNSAREERERGYTVVGPHRDDLKATLDGHDVRAFASQGQTRAFVLAMKIAEIAYLEERYHFAPILLLDDVSSELDRQRNEQLFSFLRDRAQGQVFITTTHRDHILLDEDLASFRVEGGSIAPDAST